MLRDYRLIKSCEAMFPHTQQMAKLHQKKRQHFETEQGLTLIEGLIAIVIIAITVVSISPPIFWAIATRVQTQRAEQALRIAQGEIDRVRTLVERNEVAVSQNQVKLLPPSPEGATESDVRNRSSGKFPVAPSEQKAATVVSIRDCGASANDDGLPSSKVNAFVRVDTNGDCRADYLMQSFRSQGLNQFGTQFQATNANEELAGFVMGVRVYSVLAEPALTSGKGKTDPASLRATNGLGNQLDRPLAVLYSTVVRSADSRNLEVYHRLCPPESRTTGAC